MRVPSRSFVGSSPGYRKTNPVSTPAPTQHLSPSATKPAPKLLTSAEMSADNLSPDLLPLLADFSDVFAEPVGLPPERGVEHHIQLQSGSLPKHQHPYRTSHSHKDAIEKIVQEMLQSGIIQHSRSPFASPVILVKKKDNTWRMCVDYRYLNSLTVKHDYPIPIIDELLDELFGAQFFSKIDLRSGYFQILVRPQDRYLTSFSTHHGQFEFLVMPFGLCNAPATFQSLMNQVFQSCLRKFVLVFFDDILIYSKSWADHLSHLKDVLGLLRQHSLYAKKSKCSFGKEQIDYLGHIITANGVATDPDKIACMVAWPTPKNVKQLRGFLGLTGYYRKFIRNYGILSSPLTVLLKKDNFLWTAEADRAFQNLKVAMTSAPVLALPNFTKPFVLETDASGKGVGAVLMQDQRPIAFLSKALGVRNQVLSIYEREFLAIIIAVQKWKTYLQGHKFIMKTDQQALRHLLDQKSMNPTQQRWLTKLLGLHYEIQYKSGVENKVADALSRNPVFSHECATITTVSPLWIQKVLHSYNSDAFVNKIFSAKAIDPTAYPDFSITEGLLRYKGRVVVESDSVLRTSIIEEVHHSSYGGHSGINGTYMRMRNSFYWPGMKKNIIATVHSCQACQKNKANVGFIPGLLQPLPMPSTAWTHISMDFIEGLPKSKPMVPDTDDEGKFLLQPQSLLDNRRLHRQGIEVLQLLVQWEKSKLDSATWEDFMFLVRKFPTFDPCGQGSIEGGGIVMERWVAEKERVLKKKRKLGLSADLGKIGEFPVKNVEGSQKNQDRTRG